MDPDQCLRELREAVASMKVEMSKGFAGDIGDDADVAIAKFEALDQWLSRGGFLPADWRKHER